MTVSISQVPVNGVIELNGQRGIVVSRSHNSVVVMWGDGTRQRVYPDLGTAEVRYVGDGYVDTIIRLNGE